MKITIDMKIKNLIISALFIVFSIIYLLSIKVVSAQSVLVNTAAFSRVYKGKQVNLYTLSNSNGMQVQLTNYGGRIVSILVPDKNGAFGDVCLGFESLEGYLNGTGSMGATIGPFVNRIANASFILNGKQFNLDRNNGKHSIHSGSASFRYKVWDVKNHNVNSLNLSVLSEDGTGGFPGNIRLNVEFRLSNKNELIINYSATTDKETVVNFTNHAFFNLAGAGNGSVLDHNLMIKAHFITENNLEGIPTGNFLKLKNTPLDFTVLKPIREVIFADNAKSPTPGNNNNNFVLLKQDTTLPHVATLQEPVTGRVMKVYTTEPGLQFYSPSSLRFVGKNGKEHVPFGSVCLETQHFPDSPNHPNFPSCILEPGSEYKSTTVYKFEVE